MENVKELWEVAETPLQVKILAGAIRSALLMADKPYYAVNEKKGSIYEVLPNGKALSPLVLAIKMGAPAESIKLLLQEEERRLSEWMDQYKEQKKEKTAE